MEALGIRDVKLRHLVCLTFMSLFNLVDVAPTAALPINSQLPPVARVGQPFQFCFAESTFTSPSTLQYSMTDSPEWLHFDGVSRLFSGTPGANDVGVDNFTLTANDNTGSTSMAVTFIVSSSSGPGVGMSVTSQLDSAGVLSGAETLFLYPSSNLSVHFDGGTFTNTNHSTQYYAMCANNTPLPSWLHFDPDNLSFTGTTPAFDSPSELPQDFGINLIASDVPGFSAAVATFSLLVDLHQLDFGSQELTYNITAGQTFELIGLLSALFLDNEPIVASDLVDVTAQPPTWLSLNPSNLTLSGTAPEDFSATAFLVSVTDKYNDQANTTVHLSTGATAAIFSGVIPKLNATIGRHFFYTLNSSLFPVANVDIQMDLKNSSSWLAFDAASLTLSGWIPTTLTAQTDVLNLTVSQGTKSVSNLILLAIEENSSYPSPAAPSTNGPPSSPTTAPPEEPPGMAPSSLKVSLGAVIGLVIVGVLMLVIAFLTVCICHRRSSKRNSVPCAIIGEPEDLERMERMESAASSPHGRPRTMSPPPRLEMYPQLQFLGMGREGYLGSGSPEKRNQPLSTFGREFLTPRSLLLTEPGALIVPPLAAFPKHRRTKKIMYPAQLPNQPGINCLRRSSFGSSAEILTTAVISEPSGPRRKTDSEGWSTSDDSNETVERWIEHPEEGTAKIRLSTPEGVIKAAEADIDAISPVGTPLPSPPSPTGSVNPTGIYRAECSGDKDLSVITNREKHWRAKVKRQLNQSGWYSDEERRSPGKGKGKKAPEEAGPSSAPRSLGLKALLSSKLRGSKEDSFEMGAMKKAFP